MQLTDIILISVINAIEKNNMVKSQAARELGITLDTLNNILWRNNIKIKGVVGRKPRRPKLNFKFNEYNLDLLKEKFNDRELYLIKNRILTWTPETLESIGVKYGISRQRVNEIENRVINKLSQFEMNK